MAESKAVAAFLANKPRKAPAWMPDGKAPPLAMRAPITPDELFALMRSHGELLEALKVCADFLARDYLRTNTAAMKIRPVVQAAIKAAGA